MDAIGHDRMMSDASPIVALELLVDVLAQSDAPTDSDDFYSTLAAGICRLTGMPRSVIFRYDDARRRAQVAGAHGLEIDRFAGQLVTAEDAPIGLQALAEDRVIEIREASGHRISPKFADMVRDRPIIYVPIAAAGHWFGLMLVDPGEDAEPLDEGQRNWLWTLGKALALASMSRVATRQRERARALEERIDLARQVHETTIQRLFGVSLVLSSSQPLTGQARERCAAELQSALTDLRSALQRPLGASSRETCTTLAAELDRLAHLHPDLGITVCGEVPELPASVEPLAQSVLAEAVRNARKHSNAARTDIRFKRREDAFVMEIANDGVAPASRRANAAGTGMGLRLAALEALSVGGLVEFGQREPGTWHVRLVVPDAEVLA